MDILDRLEQDDAPPPRLGGCLATETHLDQELSEAHDLKRPSCPLVARARVCPCACVACMERGRDERLVLGVSLDKLGDDGIMVQAQQVERGRNCEAL